MAEIESHCDGQTQMAQVTQVSAEFPDAQDAGHDVGLKSNGPGALRWPALAPEVWHARRPPGPDQPGACVQPKRVLENEYPNQSGRSHASANAPPYCPAPQG